ncbi:hypothetical protein YC2023_119427 [Brassica napus]
MKGEEFPNSLLSSGFSFLVYESWSSKSLYVTISMLSDFVVKATPTHSKILVIKAFSYFRIAKRICN